MTSTGEGGMMGFKKKQHKIKAEILRDHGMSKKVKYWHEEIGFNFRITNLQSSIGCAQLERIKWFIKNKLNLAKIINRNCLNLIFNFTAFTECSEFSLVIHNKIDKIL